MVVGVEALRKINLGREGTAGTAVPATSRWRGTGAPEDLRSVVFPRETVGYLTGMDRNYTERLFGGFAMESTPATFEQLPHILEAGVKAIGTGVADGTGSGKIYTYTFPTTSLNTVKTYTIEGGDNQQAEEMEYAFVDNFSLSGKSGEAVMMGAEWIGRQVTNTTFTTNATLPTVETILFGKGKLYIDTSGGTLGTTQVSSTLLAMEFTGKTGILPKFTADGALYFTFINYVMPELELKLTYEHNASAVTEKTAWRAETPRLIQVKFEGTTLGTAGVYTAKTIKINLAGRYESWEAIDDEDGNDIVVCTFRPRYNSTAAKFAEIIVVNELTTIP